MIVHNNSKPKIKFNVDEIELEYNKMGNTYVKGAVSLFYHRGDKMSLTPFLETTNILFQHEKSYNKDTKHLKMGKLTFNIEPLLLQ